MILIDCPPALGLLTINGLVAADWALISSEAQYFALQGVEGALEVVAQAKEYYNDDLEWLGVVLNIADMRTVHSREAFESLKEHFGDKVFDTVIRSSIAYAESAERARSILDHRPDLGADYLELADEVLERVDCAAPRRKLKKLIEEPPSPARRTSRAPARGGSSRTSVASGRAGAARRPQDGGEVGREPLRLARRAGRRPVMRTPGPVRSRKREPAATAQPAASSPAPTTSSASTGTQTLRPLGGARGDPVGGQRVDQRAAPAGVDRRPPARPRASTSSSAHRRATARWMIVETQPGRRPGGPRRGATCARRRPGRRAAGRARATSRRRPRRRPSAPGRSVSVRARRAGDRAEVVVLDHQHAGRAVEHRAQLARAARRRAPRRSGSARAG